MLCLDENGRPTGTCTTVDITSLLLGLGEEVDGLVSLSETLIDEVFAQPELATAWQTMDDQSKFAAAVSALTGPRLCALVGVEGASGRATGVIVRAHRRY